ncbi:alpha/beta hydrolase family protein [Ferrimicrobium acidiphilum]|uniref:alpha/beta hydrolase family protein n=1 Tax=Ferrimicrobium acidiphilum TaxID=121039 RepID=UPI0023F2075F|nr:alpha/beta fold hydrolase [Ferrimicrobium acidiphilum]
MPDALVLSAIENWGPRFVTNGVDIADFNRLTSSIERWSDWCKTWSKAGNEHRLLGEEALASGEHLSAGAHLAQAAVYYHFAKFLFVDYPDEMRTAHSLAVECLDKALPYLQPAGERVAIAFENTSLAGILRRPRSSTQVPAVVVLIPGLDSTKEEFRSTEQLFLDRGLATLSIDGPGQGEAEYQLGARGDWEGVGAAILAFIDTRSDLDARRVGVWGVSLGGYYAPRMVSGNPRYRACTALSGPFHLGDDFDHLPELTKRAFMARTKSASIKEARECAETFSLREAASSIRCPLQIIFGAQDRLFSTEGAYQLRRSVSGPVELIMLEQGNHGCSNLSYRHRYLTADWMRAQLA